MLRDLNAPVKVGEFLLSHPDDAGRQRSDSSLKEADDGAPNSPGEIESETSSEIEITLNADSLQSPPDSGEIPVSPQFAVALPVSTIYPSNIAASRRLTRIGAILILLFACGAATLAGFLRALSLSDAGPDGAASAVNDWTDSRGPIAAQRKTDGALAISWFVVEN